MNIVVFIFVGIFVGLIFSYSTIKKIVRIYRTPIYQINKLPESGQILVIGKADTQNTRSPLKRRNCSLWQVEVEGRNYYPQWREYYWEKIYSQISQEPFELIDGTGRIQVFPANAQLVLHTDFHKSGNFLSPLPPRIKSVIEELGVMTIDAPGIDRQLRVYERIVEPDDEIYILGEVHYENGRKLIIKGDKFPFIISDRREDEVLSTLFKQVVGNVVFATVFVVIVLLVSSNQ